MHEREHAFLILLGEIFGYIHLSHCLAERTIHYTHSALPERTRFFATGHHFAVEIERSHVYLGGQIRSSTLDHLPAEQGLQILQRLIRQHLACLFEVRDLSYGKAVQLHAKRLEIHFPVHLRY